MTDLSSNFMTLRAAVTLVPPPGASERVLRHLVASEPRQARSVRTLVVVLATFITTTAAALGSGVPRWVEQRWALAVGAHATPALPRAATPTARHTAPPAALASPVPGPDLPELPTPPQEPAPTVALNPRASAHADAVAPSPSESLLAQQVAAYREASSLVAASPGLAIVRLRAFQERWPQSPLGEEVSVRMVQALVGLGHDADARIRAREFVVRYPTSRRRAEMEALSSGAPLNRAEQ